jgi:hypothetical protein
MLALCRHKLTLKRTSLLSLRCSTSSDDNDTKYLHIAPCGDFWIAEGIFAAKHNPSGFIRSIAIGNVRDSSAIIDTLQQVPSRDIMNMYDTGKILSSLEHFQVKATSISPNHTPKSRVDKRGRLPLHIAAGKINPDIYQGLCNLPYFPFLTIMDVMLTCSDEPA